jgi:hypothetical protein
MQFATSHDCRTQKGLDGPLAYGALSALMKDNLYWFGPCGFRACSSWTAAS